MNTPDENLSEVVDSEEIEEVEESEEVEEEVKEPENDKAVPPAVDSADDKKIKDAVGFINKTANSAIYKASIKVGEYILEEFFDDDIELAKSKDPNKQGSYVKLCRSKDLAVHPSRLGLMVRVAAQERFLAEQSFSKKGLSYTHRTLLVKMEDSQEKIFLTQECLDKKWTSRELDKNIKEKLKKSVPSSSHEALIQGVSKYRKKIEGTLNLDASKLKIDDEALTNLPDDDRKKLMEGVEDLKAKAEQSTTKSGEITSECDALLSKLGQREIESEENGGL